LPVLFSPGTNVDHHKMLARLHYGDGAPGRAAASESDQALSSGCDKQKSHSIARFPTMRCRTFRTV